MSDDDPEFDEDLADLEAAIAEERRREIAVEHLLFQTIAHLGKNDPGLLDHLEASVAHLGDSANDETKDDEAVRAVARAFLASLRAEN